MSSVHLCSVQSLEVDLKTERKKIAQNSLYNIVISVVALSIIAIGVVILLSSPPMLPVGVAVVITGSLVAVAGSVILFIKRKGYLKLKEESLARFQEEKEKIKNEVSKAKDKKEFLNRERQRIEARDPEPLKKQLLLEYIDAILNYLNLQSEIEELKKKQLEQNKDVSKSDEQSLWGNFLYLLM